MLECLKNFVSKLYTFFSQLRVLQGISLMFWNTSACLAQLGRISRPLVSTFVTHAQSVHPQILWGLQISPIVKVRYIIRDAFLFICFKFRALSYRTNYCSTLWLFANASSFYTLYIKYLIGIKLHWPAWMIIFSRLLFIFFLVFLCIKIIIILLHNEDWFHWSKSVNWKPR